MGARFSAHALTGPGAQPTSNTMCNKYQVSFPEAMLRSLGVNHPLPHSAEVKERVELYIYSPMGLHNLFRVTLPLYVYTKEAVK